MPRGDPQIDLSPVAYAVWLEENPKLVDQGPILLKPKLLFSDPDAVKFDSHIMTSKRLPNNYADKLVIFSEYDEFTGFYVWVTVKGYDFLLMAHQTHYRGHFFANGRKYFNHPHFHQLDLLTSNNRLGPDSIHEVPPGLFPGMNAAQLLEAFMINYYIDDGRDEPVQMPEPVPRQMGLEELD